MNEIDYFFKKQSADPRFQAINPIPENLKPSTNPYFLLFLYFPVPPNEIWSRVLQQSTPKVNHPHLEWERNAGGNPLKNASRNGQKKNFLPVEKQRHPKSASRKETQTHKKIGIGQREYNCDKREFWLLFRPFTGSKRPK